MKRHTLTFPIQMTKTKTINPVFLIGPAHYRNNITTIHDGSFGWDAGLPIKDMKVSEVWAKALQVIKDKLVEAELQFTKFVKDAHERIGA